MSHTPTPWRTAYHGNLRRCKTKIEAGHLVVADTIDNEANAERIVACVNACAGMADPAAEIASLKTALSGRTEVCNEQSLLRQPASQPPRVYESVLVFGVLEHEGQPDWHEGFWTGKQWLSVRDDSENPECKLRISAICWQPMPPSPA